MRILRAGLIFPFLLVSLVAGASLLLIPTWRRRERARAWMRRTWARGMLWFFRVRVTVDPSPPPYRGGVVYVANHTGYLDIFVVLSIAPGLSISRERIAWWPIVGQIVALGGSLFVDRRNRLGITRFVNRMRQALRRGAGVVLFPEGTSTDGTGLLPFKTPLFAAAEERDGEAFPVRPMVLRYQTLGGKPIDESNRDRVYWYGDAGLLGHVWQLLGGPSIEVRVKILPERTIRGGRRAFADELRREMARVYETLGTAR